MSQFHPSLCVFVLLFSSLVACQKFSRGFKEKAFTCGVEPGLYQDHAHLLQILDAGNQPLSPTRIQTLKVGQRQDGQWTSLAISRGGCVVVEPEASLDILVQDPVQNEAAYLHLEPRAPDHIRLPLQKRRAFSMRFSCPVEAYAADEQLDLNAFYAGDGAAQAGLWLTFEAHRWDEAVNTLVPESAHSLWDHALDQKSFPQSLNMRSLPEGRYKLIARAGYLQPDQSPQDLPVLGPREGCPLHIIRQQPAAPRWAQSTAALHEAQPPELVVPVHEPLALIKDAELKLEYCVEDAAQPLTGCEPRTNCKGSAAVFTQAETISLPEPGSWAVFARTRDAAGHLSPLTCANVRASATAPGFSVQWSEPAWNTPFPLVSLPPVQVQALVTDLQHPVVGRHDLEQSLECRVTVTSSMGNARPAHYSRCLSGRCAGHALRDWQPCSPHITVDLSQEWLRSENWESSITLHVRASDQAGHPTEVRKNLWFSGQRWSMHEVKLPGSDPDSEFWDTQLLKTLDGNLFTNAGGGSRLQRSSTRSELQSDPGLETMIQKRRLHQVELVEDAEAVSLWGFWTFQERHAPVLGKKNGESWIFNPKPEAGGPDQNCLAFGRSHQAQLLCLNESSLSVLDTRLRWQKKPLLDSTGHQINCPTERPLSRRYTESKTGRWFLCDDTTLLFQTFDQSHWQKANPPAALLSDYRNIFTSADGDVWILGNVNDVAAKILAHHTGQWEDRSQGFEEPLTLSMDDDPAHDLRNFHSLPSGALRFGTQAYDPAVQRWRSLLPDSLQKYEGLAEDHEGGLWTIVAEKALLRFYPSPIIIPLEMLGLQASSRLIDVARDGSSLWLSLVPSGSIIYQGNIGIFQLDLQPWQSLPFGFVRTPAYDEAWTQMIKDSQGRMLLQRENGELAALDPHTGWSLLSLPADRPAALKKDLTLVPQGENFLVQAADGDLWLWDLKSFEAIPSQGESWSQAPDLRFSRVDGQGRIWADAQLLGEPYTLFQRQDKRWIRAMRELPPECTGRLIFHEGDRLLFSCGGRGLVIIYGETITWLSEAFPEINFQDPDLMTFTIPVNDPNTPYIFFSTFHFQSREQILHRYEPRTGRKTQWTVPDDGRLHLREDIFFEHVPLDSIVLDPQQPERFLITTFRFILRPEAGILKVAMDGGDLVRSRGLHLEPGSGRILGLDLQRHGEVWILMRELGLLRYDGIWNAEAQ
ncbi:hypothetical protein [Oligoflexus tunisiensis]|uniref:hypothetical protein n=1 Tax=Oligoflexus tunisiensis TaxID=708132 RepID=UPI00114D2E72|nr:hypothetical protein [Oligoflexus tunisiensis]